MSALTNDIAAATREAIIERYENTAVRDALTGARDGSLTPGEGFFDLLGDAKTIVDERGLVLAGDPRFSVSVAALVWSDPSRSTPAVRLVDAEQSVDARLCCSRIELDLEEEVTSFELFYAGDVDMTPPPVGPGAMRIAPAAAGSGDGSSWENAGSLANLDAFATIAGQTGREIWIRADAGQYADTTRILRHGGTADKPLVVRGVDVNGDRMKAPIVGTRASPWIAGAANGNSTGTLLLLSGADHLVLQDLHFENCGLGCIRVGGPVANLTVQDITFNNVREFFANTQSGSAGGGYASIDGLTIQRVTGKGFSKRFARVQYDSRNILIADCVGDSDRQDGDNFSSGIVFDHTAHDALVVRCTMGNIIDTLHRYQNGDGFAGERGNYNITLEDCVAHHCTDGGYDFKSDSLIMRRCVGEYNHRNFRLWGLCKLYDCISRECIDNAGANPYAQGHFNVFQNGMLELIRCRAESTSAKAPVFRAEVAGIMSIDAATTWAVPSGTTIRFTETANSGKAAGLIIDRPTDNVAPVIQSPGIGLSIDENKPGSFPYTASKPAQLRRRGGADISQFGADGAVLKIYRQDYEANPNPRRVDLAMIDGQGLWSATQMQSVAINDVADDPTSPAILLADGVTGGAWLEVAKQYCWQDIAGTIPCTDGSPCARIDDRFGFGNHALQPDPNLVGTFQDDGTTAYIQMDNAYYLVGANGSMNFPELTATMAQRRDDIDKDIAKWLLAVGRSADLTSTNNLVWEMRVQGGQSLNLRIGSSSDSSSAGGPVISTNSVVSIQTKPSTGRNNGGQLFDGSDRNALSYPVAGSLILGASANRTGNMLGRMYGCVITNRTETTEGTNNLFRIERQLGFLCNLDL